MKITNGKLYVKCSRENPRITTHTKILIKDPQKQKRRELNYNTKKSQRTIEKRAREE